MSELALEPTPSAEPTPETQKAQQQRTANRLTLTQTFALGTWIQDHRAIAADKPDTAGADHASIDLGFTVTAANFSAARQALGILKTQPAKPPTVEERLAALETDHSLRAANLRLEIDTTLSDILRRITALENNVGDNPTVEERLAALEQQNRRNWEGAGDDIKALEDRLNALEEKSAALEKQNLLAFDTNNESFRMVAQHLTALDQRIGSIEQQLTAPAPASPDTAKTTEP